jgi:2-polyprenyl-3-methyl-5-hydroxy-6-metoxy-1,4-benzoquinol methylase
MRDYVSQSHWRLEKSRRLLRLIMSTVAGSAAKKEAQNNPIGLDPKLLGINPDLEQETLLDIGSGAGYVRKAASELQLKHFGLDSSPSAIEICQSKFGFETMQGNIAQLPKLASQLEKRCDYITLFDVIEHLDDPVAAINNLKPLLASRGCIVIRTPNLVSFEYDALGDYYYSFKLDHIQYFSPNSLDKLMTICGLTQLYLETSSHFFKGLLGMDFIHQCGKGKIGADILAIYS